MGGSNRAFEPGSLQVAQPYFISGKSGVIAAGMAAGADLFTIVNFGMLDPRTPGAIVPTPIQISQIRIKFVAVTAFTAGGFAIEIHKVTGFTVQSTTNGVPVTPIRRKTTGYPAIGATEVSGYVVDTAAAGVTGGTFSLTAGAALSPLNTAVGSGTLPAFESIWRPDDLVPLQLEANEGLVFRNAITQAVGTGLFYGQVDFLR